MDPTRQRRQAPLKASLDLIVWGWTTYVLPTVAAGLLFSVIYRASDALFWTLVVPSLYFWAVAYAAVSTYRRQLLVPRATDLLLDPSSEEYWALATGQTLLALGLPLGLRLLFRADDPLLMPVAAASALAYWGAAATQQMSHVQQQGHPLIPDGAQGQRIKPAAALRKAIERHLPGLTNLIPWGGAPLDQSWLLKNFLVLGSVGSGKTLVLRQWLANVLPQINQHPHWRAMIVDPKWELLPFVLNLVPAYKVIAVNPGDARGYAWRIAEDLTDDHQIHQAAHLLMPSHKNQSQPFFDNAARQLFMGVMLALRFRAAHRWWFSDVFFATRSAKRLKGILSLTPVTRDIIDTYANNERLFFDVFSTLDSNLGDYFPIAASWSQLQRRSPSRSISLTSWVTGNQVLIVGKKASAEAAQGRISSVLLKRASQLLLDQPTGQSIKDPATASRTILVIDEAARAGGDSKLDLLQTVSNARDYGVGFFIATQSVEAVIDQYGDKGWDALASEFHTAAFLNTNSPVTAKWMSDRVGKCIGFRQPGQHGGRPAQLESSFPTLDPSLFMTLAQGKQIHPGCVPGVFTNSQWGAWYSEEGVSFPPDCPGVPQLEPAESCTLRPWDDEDLKRLNLTDARHLLALDEPDPPRPRSGPNSRRHPPTNYPKFRP